MAIFQEVTRSVRKFFLSVSTRTRPILAKARFLLYLRDVKKWLFILLFSLLAGAELSAQTQESLEAVRQARRPVTGTPMEYRVEDGDTTFIDTIDPVWVFPKGRRMASNDWRRYYKTVYHFNKVYPYALVGRKMMAQVDSTIAADVSKRSQRSAYIHDVERELLRIFEKDIRSMTISQGLILVKLVDRECGMNPYTIIKTYVSGFAASFWQLVAKLFSQDLKASYDPTGKDAQLEELVRIWDSGQWDSFYYSIFMEYPKKTVIKTETLDSEVKKR